MPSILGKFTKQSDEVLDYDVSFVDWFENRTDTAASHTCEAETGITVDSSTLGSSIVRVVLSGGTSGAQYKITVLLTTSAGIVKEVDFVVKVRDV